MVSQTPDNGTSDAGGIAPETGNGFRITFSPYGAICAVCDCKTNFIHIELRDKPTCNGCVDDEVPSDWLDLAEALDEVDTVLALARSGNRPGLLDDAIRAIFHMGDLRVEGGREELLPNVVVADELLRRRPDRINPDKTMAIIGAFVPGINRDELNHIFDSGEIRAARNESTAGDMAIALLLLARTPGGREGTTNMRDAVAHHQIDYNRFVGAVTAAAAEAGVSPRDLPVDVVNDCLRAAKVQGGAE